jgi:hypothetical protein
MKKNQLAKPTQAQVQELFLYDQTSGLLIRKENHYRARKGPQFNLNHDGYLTVCVKGKSYTAHTIIWLHQKGYWPKQIDHKNQCKCDNRIENLKEVTASQNQRNRINRKACFLIPGVYLDSCWCASIGYKNKNFYLGSFDSFTEAVCHRLAAEQCIDDASYELNSPAYIYVQTVVQKRKSFRSLREHQVKNFLSGNKHKMSFKQYQKKLKQSITKKQ